MYLFLHIFTNNNMCMIYIQYLTIDNYICTPLSIYYPNVHLSLYIEREDIDIDPYGRMYLYTPIYTYIHSLIYLCIPIVYPIIRPCGGA